MDLSIVIVSWNVKKLLRENLNSIYKNTKKIDFEIFVVDNNSSDNTTEMIESEFPNVRLIKNNTNYGFAKANNQAIMKSSGRYVLLLNPDMRVVKKTLDDVVCWMDKNKGVGVAGCKLVDDSGEIVKHVRRFPSVFDQLMIVLKVPHLFPSVLDNYLMNDFDYSNESAVDSIRGSFFVIRKEVVESVGLLDENYFIWFEEVDYCKRVDATDWRVSYIPTVKCVDYIGKSFSMVDRGRKQVYFRNSMLYYFKKWHPSWQYVLLKIAWPIGIFLSKIKK